VYDSLLIVIVACTGRFLFIGVRAIKTGFAEIQTNVDEAARVAQVPWWRTLLGIHLPLLLPTVVAASALTFVFSFGELDVTVLVAPPGWTPLPVRLFSLMHYGPSQTVAALCITIVAITLLCALVALLLYRKLGGSWHERN